jgi:hypothetical protein
MIRVVAVSMLITLGVTACAVAQDPPVATPLAAAKTTCDELVLAEESVDLVLVDRALVPYSRTILGVETTYEDGRGRTLTMVSGGYLDDITETYDDLQPAGTIRLVGETADLLRGTFLGTRIAVAYRLGADPPCSTLAVVGIGFSTEVFKELARDMTLRVHGEALTAQQ